MPELLAPTIRLRVGWLEAHEEWGPGAHEDGFGLLPEDDVTSPAGFTEWVDRLNAQSDPTTGLNEGEIHCTYRWIVEDERVLGGIALRHELNEFWMREGGNVGYGIRPSARGRGLAAWALDRMLAEARTIGLGQVLVVCTVENIASAKTIEGCGGVLQDILQTDQARLQRYWISTDRSV
jgi:predicted acetyltransferase